MNRVFAYLEDVFLLDNIN